MVKLQYTVNLSIETDLPEYVNIEELCIHFHDPSISLYDGEDLDSGIVFDAEIIEYSTDEVSVGDDEDEAEEEAETEEDENLVEDEEPEDTDEIISTMNKVFVYGTLMEGQPLHTQMGKSVLLGKADTVDGKYTMYDNGCPVVVPDEKKGKNVVGEVYHIGKDTLASLDMVESGYRRRLVKTGYGLAWMYIKDKQKNFRKKVPNNDWKAYRTKG